MTSSNDEIDVEALAESVNVGELSVGTSTEVASAAKKTASKAKQVRASVGDVMLYLKTDPVRSDVLDIEHPPGFREILDEGTFAQAVHAVLSVAEKYRKGELPDPATLDRDLLYLGAWQVDLAMRVGYAEGSMHHAETSFKLARDRYLLKAKEFSDGQNISMTAPVMSAVARDAAEDLRTYLGRYLALVHTFRSLYFANKQLIEVMDHAAARLAHERRLPQEG